MYDAKSRARISFVNAIDLLNSSVGFSSMSFGFQLKHSPMVSFWIDCNSLSSSRRGCTNEGFNEQSLRLTEETLGHNLNT